VIAQVPFAPDLRAALIARAAERGELLERLIALEAGESDRAWAIVPDAGETYLQSRAWASDAADPLFAHSLSA
jgi:hypothetical protein